MVRALWAHIGHTAAASAYMVYMPILLLELLHSLLVVIVDDIAELLMVSCALLTISGHRCIAYVLLL